MPTDASQAKINATLSAMICSTDAMDQAAFDEFFARGNMPGYKPWRNFIPGDYEYKDAAFRVVMESANSDRGLLRSMQVSVDVPDVSDRGSATITAGSASSGLFIAYARQFHVIPEIVVLARGGVTNPTVAELVGLPGLTGFTVRLRDTVTGAFVAGSLSWAANGY
jgi:hypothetical protein